MVPNLYATLAHAAHALGNYLTLQNGQLHARPEPEPNAMEHMFYMRS